MAPSAAPRKSLRRLAVALSTASAIGFLFVASHSMAPWPDVLFGGDFVAFWAGAVMVRDGAGPLLFDMEMQHALQRQWRLEGATTEVIRQAPGFVPYLNPPPLAILLLPLALLSLPWAFVIWEGATLVAFLLATSLPLRRVPNARTITLLLLSFPPVADTLTSGRLEGALLLAFTLGLLAMSSGRPVLGGALVGLLWLKPQYVALFALVLLARRRWRELAGMAGTVACLLALSLAVIGPDGLARYVEVLGRISAFHSPLAAGTKPQIMITWRAMLLHPSLAIPEAVADALVLALGGATWLASLLVWSGRWEPGSPRFGRQWLVATMATLAAGPHAHYQGAVLLLAPLALVIQSESREPLAQPWDRSIRGPRFLALIFGWLLAMVVWMFLDLRWLMAVYLAAAFGVLTWQDVREAGVRPRESQGRRATPGVADRIREAEQPPAAVDLP